LFVVIVAADIDALPIHTSRVSSRLTESVCSCHGYVSVASAVSSDAEARARLAADAGTAPETATGN